jgi:hypothetical protein
VGEVTEHSMDAGQEPPEQARPGAGSHGAGGVAPPAPRPARTIVDDALALQAEIQAERVLLESGTPGRATVLGLTDTGVLVNFNPQVVLELSVTVGGHPPYDVQLSTAVPARHLSRLHAGSDVGVRVDPSQPQRLAIDWPDA